MSKARGRLTSVVGVTITQPLISFRIRISGPACSTRSGCSRRCRRSTCPRSPSPFEASVSLWSRAKMTSEIRRQHWRCRTRRWESSGGWRLSVPQKVPPFRRHLQRRSRWRGPCSAWAWHRPPRCTRRVRESLPWCKICRSRLGRRLNDSRQL